MNAVRAANRVVRWFGLFSRCARSRPVRSSGVRVWSAAVIAGVGLTLAWGVAAGQCRDYDNLYLEWVGGVDTPGGAYDVVVVGSYAYVADALFGLQVIDITDPENPVIVGNANTPYHANGVAVAGGYAYVADGPAGFQVIDITSPVSPVIVGSVDTPHNAVRVAVAGSYAYVTDDMTGLLVIDITDPAAPVIVGGVDTPDSAHGVFVAGSYAYVADENSGLLVIDITNPTSPVIVGSENTPTLAYDVDVVGSLAFVADGPTGLRVIDVTNPASPVTVGSVDTPGVARQVAVVGRYAYVADDSFGLQVIDIANPAAPVIIGNVDTPDFAYGVAVSGGYAYVADAASGLQVVLAQCQCSVADTGPPVLACPLGIKVACSQSCGVPATDPQIMEFLNAASASDICDDDVDITNDAPPCFPIGMTAVTFTATDDSGNQGTCVSDVIVYDTTPPQMFVGLNRDVLWPPNRKMADIAVTMTVTDVCCATPTFVLVSITSSEPDKGKGNTSPDIMDADFGTPDVAFQLRAEWNGTGDGRVYTIVYEAEDCAGNKSTATAEVRVTRAQSGLAFACTGFHALDQGIGFDPSLDEIALIIRSRPAQSVIDGSGNSVLVSAGFDATSLDVKKAYVGNVKGVTLPVRSLVIDNDADGLMDLALFYSARAVNMIIQASAPTGGGDFLENGGSHGPIGLHYRSASGIDYLVPNIFALGEPVPLVPQIPYGRGGGLSGPTSSEMPRVTALLPCYPNPFNPTTTVPFQLVTQGRVSLRIYDAQGKLVRTLADEVMPAGLHSVVWDGLDNAGLQASTGIYFVRLEAGADASSRKIVMIK